MADVVSEIVTRTCSNLSSGNPRKWSSSTTMSSNKQHAVSLTPWYLLHPSRTSLRIECLPTEEMIIMRIIWHAPLLRHPKRMTSSSILRDLIISRYIRLKLVRRLALFAVKEKKICFLIDINTLRHSALCAKTKNSLLGPYISLFKKMANLTIFASNVCKMIPERILFQK